MRKHNDDLKVIQEAHSLTLSRFFFPLFKVPETRIMSA